MRTPVLGESQNCCLELFWLSSPRWGEFIEKDKKKRTTVFCKLCPKQLPYNDSTTNMMAHLRYNHPSEFKKTKEKSNAVVPTAQRPKGQPSVAEAFQHLEPLSRSSQRWKNLTSSVC